MGARAGIPGLDVVIDDLDSLFRDPTTIVVRGLPGTGKTFFALQLAYRHFCQRLGYDVTYWDLEQQPTVAERLIGDFAWGEPGPGVWRLGHSRFKLSDLVSEAERWRPQANHQGLVVVDSLSSIDEHPSRCALDKIRQSLTGTANSVLFVLEEPHETDTKYQWMDYFADVVFALGAERRAGYSTRVFEVVKCRARRTERGPHPLSVILPSQAPSFGMDTGGLCIYPSLSCRLGMSARRILRARRERGALATTVAPADLQPERQFGLPGVELMIGRSGQLQEDESVILLGEGGCQKSSVALHTLLPPVRSGKPVLIISFGMSEQRLLDEVRSYQDLNDLLDGDGFANGVDVFFCPPGHEGPERILTRLETKILSAGHAIGSTVKYDPVPDTKETGALPLAYSRALVLDLGSVPHGFPSCHDQPMFAVALHQFLLEHGITPVFVETRHADEAQYSSHVADWTSLVLEFRHLTIYGHDHIGLRVRRREGPDVSGDFRELRTLDSEGGKRRLDVAPTLDGFTNLLSGEPRPAPISVYLHAETMPQRLFNQRVRQTLQLALPGVAEGMVKVGFFSHASAEAVYQGLHFTTSVPQPDACVVTLDEWWAHHLADMHHLLPIELTRDQREQFVGVLPDPSCEAGDQGGSYRCAALPHILNVGVSVVHRALSDLEPSLLGALWNAEVAWDARLEEMVGAALARLPSEEATWCETRPLWFDMTSHQSWACMMLEVLLACASKGGGAESTATVQDYLAAPSVVEALFRLYRVFWLGTEKCPERRDAREREMVYAFSGKAARELERRLEDPELHTREASTAKAAPAVGARVLLRRSWYTTVLGQVYEGALSPCDFTLAPVVGGRTISGHWYIAALARSSAPETARQVAKELVLSPSAAFTRYCDYVGLPAWKPIYENSSESLLACDQKTAMSRLYSHVMAADKCVSRFDLVEREHHRDYAFVSHILARLLHNVLMLEPDCATLRERITKQVGVTRRLLERGLSRT